ncbi:MAG TPA: hypothetical protein VGM74_12285 [Burkholderiaceae bacterium]|jgi:type IV pilus assembly protein PilW
MARPHRQRGLSLTELMLGMAVGLFIIASAGALFAGQLREYRAIVLDTRLTQDLRAAADLVARDLRRAGYWGHAGAANPNPYAGIDLAGRADAAAIGLRYSMDATENDAVDTNEQFGFRLHNGAIESQVGAGNWQALTDPATLTVTAFSVTPELQEIPLAAFCAAPCVDATRCAPRQQQRSLQVEITAQLAGDAPVTRSVHSTVRARSGSVIGACPT